MCELRTWVTRWGATESTMASFGLMVGLPQHHMSRWIVWDLCVFISLLTLALSNCTAISRTSWASRLMFSWARISAFYPWTLVLNWECTPAPGDDVYIIHRGFCVDQDMFFKCPGLLQLAMILPPLSQDHGVIFLENECWNLVPVEGDSILLICRIPCRHTCEKRCPAECFLQRSKRRLLLFNCRKASWAVLKSRRPAAFWPALHCQHDAVRSKAGTRHCLPVCSLASLCRAKVDFHLLVLEYCIGQQDHLQGGVSPKVSIIAVLTRLSFFFHFSGFLSPSHAKLQIASGSELCITVILN